MSNIVIQQEATRDGFGRAILKLCKENNNIYVLSCDTTESTRVDSVRISTPDQFIQVGIAEQNMIGIAAGMAIEGKIPFCPAYAVFNPGRNWDQVRVSACYQNVNVKIVGAHAGLGTGPDGATHQALEDIAITRVLPNLIVIVPSDANEAEQATYAIAKHKGPAYLRLTRPKSSKITEKNEAFTIGKAKILQEGTDVTIIGAGPLLAEALNAAEQLRKEGISCEIINMHTIKPLDTEALEKTIAKIGVIVTVEDHQIIGGLGSAIAEYTARHNPAPIEMVGIQDKFGESGDPEELYEKYGLTSTHIQEAVKKILKRKGGV